MGGASSGSSESWWQQQVVSGCMQACSSITVKLVLNSMLAA
jgi:hypothetical protein